MKKIYILPAVIIPVILAGLLIHFSSKSAKDALPGRIFLITLDTTRADHIDYSLSDNTLTPNMARLAREGIVFSRAYSLIPITLPSHASIFYSQPPHAIKVYNNKQVSQVNYPSLAQQFKKNGFKTGAVISLGVLSTHFGLSKGFDEYIENFRPDVWYKTAEEVNRDAFKLIRRMAKNKSFFWIHYSDPHAPYYPPHYHGDFSTYFNDQKIYSCDSIDQPLVKLELDVRPGRNMLVLKTRFPESTRAQEKIDIKGINFMNFSLTSEATGKELEVSLPRRWKKVEPRGKLHYYSKRKISRIVFRNNTSRNINVTIQFNYKIFLYYLASRALYRQEIQYMDSQFGQLLEFLKKENLYEDSIFLVMGDHGEGLGEHRKCVGHIHYLNKVYLNVPLFLAGKGVMQKTARDDRLVSNLNIAPTLLEIAGLKKPDSMQGVSLFKARDSGQLFLETYAPEAFSDGFSVITYPYQIIYYPQLETDKYEFINLSEDRLGIINLFNRDQQKKIKAELMNTVMKLSKVIMNIKKKPGKISTEQMEILKSLGYL
jgi:arylsulfatase A-like enzyme